jgi:hypothetical protein
VLFVIQHFVKVNFTAAIQNSAQGARVIDFFNIKIRCPDLRFPVIMKLLENEFIIWHGMICHYILRHYTTGLFCFCHFFHLISPYPKPYWQCLGTKAISFLYIYSYLNPEVIVKEEYWHYLMKLKGPEGSHYMGVWLES